MRAVPARTSATYSRLPAESDPEPEVVRIGRVGRPHGVDGAFVVEDASEDPRRFEVGAELLVDGNLAHVTVSRQVGDAAARSSSIALPHAARSSPFAATTFRRFPAMRTTWPI